MHLFTRWSPSCQYSIESLDLCSHDGGIEIESNNQSKANPTCRQLVSPAVRDSAPPNVHKHKAHSHLKKIRANPKSHLQII